MNWTPKILATVAVAAAVVAIALWLGTPRAKKPSADGGTISQVGQPGSTNKMPFKPARGTNRIRRPVVVVSSTETNVIADWETKIDEILNSKDEPDEQGRQLFAIFDRFPFEGQAEAAQHIANLLADEDYLPFGLRLADTNTLPEVQEVIFADLLGRPNKLKLSLLLEVAKTPEHPKAEESKELLELYLEKNYDDDWDTWTDKIAEWLKDNPDSP